MSVFFNDADRRNYLRLMSERSQEKGLQIISYCLMTNHIHLIAVPENERSLARAIGEAHRRYTWIANRRQDTRGYLFQGRFFSCPLDEPHMIAAIRYIERNPVRAGMVRNAWDHPWSSAAYRAALTEKDPLVFDRNPFGLALDWKELLDEDPKQVDVLRKNVRTGRPCGSERFLDEAEALTGRSLREKRRGRPSKAVGKGKK